MHVALGHRIQNGSIAAVSNEQQRPEMGKDLICGQEVSNGNIHTL